MGTTWSEGTQLKASWERWGSQILKAGIQEALQVSRRRGTGSVVPCGPLTSQSPRKWQKTCCVGQASELMPIPTRLLTQALSEWGQLLSTPPSEREQKPHSIFREPPPRSSSPHKIDIKNKHGHGQGYPHRKLGKEERKARKCGCETTASLGKSAQQHLGSVPAHSKASPSRSVHQGLVLCGTREQPGSLSSMFPRSTLSTHKSFRIKSCKIARHDRQADRNPGNGYVD